MMVPDLVLAFDVFIDTPFDVLLAFASLALVIVVYAALERIRPGYGSLPTEFSAVLAWLDDNAGDATVLAWWDYAAPLSDHTDVEPYLEGPSRNIEQFIDDPERVRTWTDPEDVAQVATFLLAESPEAALESIGASGFDYVLVGRSDLLKAQAIRESAANVEDFHVEDPDSIVLRRMLVDDIDWPIVYENDQVKIYRSPDV